MQRSLSTSAVSRTQWLHSAVLRKRGALRIQRAQSCMGAGMSPMQGREATLWHGLRKKLRSRHESGQLLIVHSKYIFSTMPVFINNQTNIVSSCGLSRRLRIAFGQCLHLPHASPGDTLFFSLLSHQSQTFPRRPSAPEDRRCREADWVFRSSLELRRRAKPHFFGMIKGQL